MTTRYPIVFEAEDSGAVSAYVPELPVYAAADTADKAEDAVRELLALYVEDRQARGLGLPEPQTGVKVARVTTSRGRSSAAIVGPAALLGHQRSLRKAAAARQNGRRIVAFGNCAVVDVDVACHSPARLASARASRVGTFVTC